MKGKQMENCGDGNMNATYIYIYSIYMPYAFENGPLWKVVFWRSTFDGVAIQALGKEPVFPLNP